MRKGRTNKADALRAVPVRWLKGIQAVVVADRIYLADQGSPRLNRALEQLVRIRMR